MPIHTHTHTLTDRWLKTRYCMYPAANGPCNNIKKHNNNSSIDGMLDRLDGDFIAMEQNTCRRRHNQMHTINEKTQRVYASQCL